jgi:hypothetical protein
MSAINTFHLKGVPSASFPEGVEVDRPAVLKSKTLRDMVEDFVGVDTIDIPSHSNDTIFNFFKYVELKDANKKEGDDARNPLVAWETEFFSKFTTGDLFNFLLVANYLDAKLIVQSTVSSVDTTDPANPKTIQTTVDKTVYDPVQDGAKVVANMIKGKTPDELRRNFAIPEGVVV